MSFKKLNPLLLETIQHLGFEGPTKFQDKILSKIKGGANLFGIAPEGAGKTTALIISTLNKLKCTAYDDSPRALILVKDKEAALKLEKEFDAFTLNTDIRISLVYEEHNINHQKDDVYLGTDIVIATPKRLSKLYFLNGIHLGELQMLIVEDADFIIRNEFHTTIARISESLSRCQHLVFAEHFNPKLEILQDLIMQNAQIIKVS